MSAIPQIGGPVFVPKGQLELGRLAKRIVAKRIVVLTDGGRIRLREGGCRSR